MTDERTITCDLDLDGWTVSEAHAYRAAVGVNPEYAWGLIANAVKASMTEARETYGEAVEAKGWKPPKDWVPLAMLNLDPVQLAGFVYVTARRADPGLDFAALLDELHVGELSQAFFGQLMATAEAAAPLVNREQKRAAAKSGRATKTATPSGTSTAARSPRSTP